MPTAPASRQCERVRKRDQREPDGGDRGGGRGAAERSEAVRQVAADCSRVMTTVNAKAANAVAPWPTCFELRSRTMNEAIAA